jgi:hypothetical protein
MSFYVRSVPGCLPTADYRISQNDSCFWILSGLREFWEIAIVLRLAAVAFSKQYCLSEAKARSGASCIAWASRKTVAPKFSAALIFAHNFNYFLRVFASSPFGLGSLVTFFVSRQRK